jgi:hypothetical protein
VEFFGVGFVFVAQDGVEDVDFLADGGELVGDGGGVLGAFLDFGGVMLVDLVQCVAVVAEVGDEVGVDLELDEAGAKGGFGPGGGTTTAAAAAAGGGGGVLKEGQQAVYLMVLARVRPFRRVARTYSETNAHLL